MRDVVAALIHAFKSLLHPRMLSLLIWPMALATLVWGVVAFSFWEDWTSAISAALEGAALHDYLAGETLSWVAGYAIFILLFLLLVPVIYVTALLITSVFAMPTMVNHVAARDYPELARKHGGTTVGSAWNAALATFIFCALWLLSLPLWLLSAFAVVIPLALSAYLNQRLFRYDALAEHASLEEFHQIVAQAGGKLYLLGGVLALIQFVPVVHFFAPAYIGLAFIHLCLAELRRLRGGAPVAA